MDSKTEEYVAGLLNQSRQSIASNQPNKALEYVIEAIRLTGGEEAIMKVLSQAKESQKTLLDNIAKQPSLSSAEELQLATNKLISEPSLLSEMGDGSEVLLQQAFEDGSSIICKKCQGLVSRERWTKHVEIWCPALDDQVDDNDVDS